MFKPDLWQSHDEYRTLVNTLGRRLSRNNLKYFFNLYDEERQKLLNLNLDPLTGYISGFYSDGGRPAKHQAQILRSLILFVLLFNKTKARTSLTLWVREVLPGSIALTVLIGCASMEELPPLASYYDFMNRFWMGSRDHYSRSALLLKGRNGKKPDKTLGTDGKLEDNGSTLTCKDIVSNITGGLPASDNPDAALQTFFTLLAVLPSVRLGLIDASNLTLSGDGTAVVPIPPLTADIFPPAVKPAHTGKAAAVIILTPMPHGAGTVTMKHGFSDIPCICSAAETTA